MDSQKKDAQEVQKYLNRTPHGISRKCNKTDKVWQQLILRKRKSEPVTTTAITTVKTDG